MAKVRAAIRNVNTWLGGVGSIVTILGFAIPETRLWLAENGLLGWLAFASALIVALIVDGFRSVSRAELDGELRQLKVDLESERSRASGLESDLEAMRTEFDRRGIDKDLRLLDELLGEIQPGSKFYRHLKDHVDFMHLPTWFDDTLSKGCERWKAEPRTAADGALADAWSLMVSRAEAFLNVLRGFLWRAGSGPDSLGDPDWLSIPIEWKYTQREEAREMLEQAHDQFLDALDALFATLHRYR